MKDRRYGGGQEVLAVYKGRAAGKNYAVGNDGNEYVLDPEAVGHLKVGQALAVREVPGRYATFRTNSKRTHKIKARKLLSAVSQLERITTGKVVSPKDSRWTSPYSPKWAARQRTLEDLDAQRRKHTRKGFHGPMVTSPGVRRNASTSAIKTLANRLKKSRGNPAGYKVGSKAYYDGKPVTVLSVGKDHGFGPRLTLSNDIITTVLDHRLTKRQGQKQPTLSSLMWR